MHKYLEILVPFGDIQGQRFEMRSLFLVIKETDEFVLIRTYGMEVLLPRVYVDLFCSVRELTDEVWNRYDALVVDSAATEARCEAHVANHQELWRIVVSKEAILAFIKDECEPEVAGKLQGEAERHFAEREQAWTKCNSDSAADHEHKQALERALSQDSKHKALFYLVQSMRQTGHLYPRDTAAPNSLPANHAV